MTSPKAPKPGQRTPEEQAAADKVFNIGCGGFILLFFVLCIFGAVQTAFETP